MIFPPGVLTGNSVTNLFEYAKEQGFAIPAVNVTGTNSINATLEAANAVKSPVIIQLSNAGAHFFAGKHLSNTNQEASITGAVSAAQHVHEVAEHYGVSVLLHTDHANRKLLPWVDGLLKKNRIHLDKTGKPLFSSHMIDLSTESIEKNLATCRKYLKTTSKLDITLEIELGVTGGIEDGFDHSDVEQSSMYTKPMEILRAYEELSKISKKFTVAASFGNVHGVYNPGNVELKPEILKHAQELIKTECGTTDNPATFVFHGGSGCSRGQIREAISYGTVKMNINTDLQWAFWQRIRDYYQQNEAYLQSQTGNPEGADKPNKPYYNPQVWLREGEIGIVNRLLKTFEDLNCINQNS
ncbi:class II fructose-bisphosphate aldolase [Aliifodinibius sp. S!AR15-10]|uniref:class II fructose-bisphosphate aldolase n=1 Tax=Aliifodinibius sp. S!AR15-10 TaxID=2950437 RepID=UPI002857078C|nr:class II fructose-bisphosphate aldolase [Aliifodinibius sp. S!AR15-10]MDR8389703.1 class II fructose-bisphosphate aldolase [Aliifodinibius sp. S!AR15-10]